MNLPRRARRLFMLLVIAALVLSVTAACGSGTPPMASADGQAVEVVFWHQASNPVERAAIEEIVANFEQANPDVQVTVTLVTGDETDVTKLMTAVRGGTGPDVYLFNRPFIAERAATGLLTDLSPFLKEDGTDLIDQYLDFTKQEITYNGKIYGLPFDTDVRALYYNKAVLRDAGVDLAELDPARGPPSLDRVLEIAATIDQTDARGAYTRLGFIPWFDQGWHYTWGYAFGGRFYDPATCAVTPTDAGVVQAMQFLYDWSKNMDPQKVKTFVDTYAPNNAPPEQSPFITGRLAMVVNGDWFVAQIAKFAPALEYGVTYIPVPPGRPATSWSAGWSLVMPTGAKQPAAAFRFMRYMAGPEGQRVYVKATKHLPTWKPLLEEQDLFTGPQAFLRTLLPQSTSLPPVPTGALYWDALSTAQQQVTANTATPQQALAEVAERVQPKVQALCAPSPSP